MTNNTFVGNNAVVGGAVFCSGYQQTLYNNILIKGSTGSNCGFFPNTPVTAGNNLADDDSCGTGFTNCSTLSDQISPLGDQGGPSQTFALQPGSSAIDAGDDSQCPDADQRGVIRQDGNQ
ncbi:choice-of-anchor Q domain-containing protein [Ornatilinea apprima]|uniref:choice-of-anchor Q domain-containing protein n=1 Tax=Ornatilinea apprima TaxID=1134406 RepID=UPI00128F93F4|nr:choice-of-anchor Q domain-containing protein [Ornatilinea apprima]